MRFMCKTSVVHCHFLPETLSGSLRLPKWFSRLFARYVIHFYKAADRVVAVSPYYITKLTELGIPQKKSHTFPITSPGIAFILSQRRGSNRNDGRWDLARRISRCCVSDRSCHVRVWTTSLHWLRQCRMSDLFGAEGFPSAPGWTIMTDGFLLRRIRLLMSVFLGSSRENR